MIEAIRNLVSKGDVLQGEKRNIAIVVICIVAGLRYFDVTIASEEILRVIQAVAEITAVVGVVYAKLRS